MKKISFGVAALILLIAGTAHAQLRECNPTDGIVWPSNNQTLAKLAAPLKQFSDGVEKARTHYGIGGDVAVVVVDCPYWGYDVLTRKIFEAIPMYGVYVSASYLKHTDAAELERKGINEVCLIRAGGTEPSDEDERRIKQLHAQYCMAKMVGDKQLLTWLDRIMPTPRDERNARADRMINGALIQMQRFLKDRQK